MEALLTVVVEGIVRSLAGRVATELYDKLKGDPAKKAFKLAIARAITTYSQGERIYYADPLIRQDGVLSFPEVTSELGHLISFSNEPNAELIGRYWRDLLDTPPAWRDFTDEAKRFLNYLEYELRQTDTFRPVFDSRSLTAIEVNTTISASRLAAIESQLAQLLDLANSNFGNLSTYFARTPTNIEQKIFNFTSFIREKTNGFIGRQFIFETIEGFLNRTPRGYLVIRGDPGIGKSAFLGQLVKNNGYVHHFNIRAEGINKAHSFLGNVCAQLIAVYDLGYTMLPPEATLDSGFLNRLLAEVSKKLEGQKCVIVIDGLDEVDTSDLLPGVNPLYLPIALPDGLYIVTSSRRVPLNLRLECEFQTLDIEHDSNENIADVREYIYSQLQHSSIRDYLIAHELSDETFVEMLVEKSEGNFMYLRYVMPEIADGIYSELSFNLLPVGLRNYYEDHWQRMKGLDKDAWFNYKLPVLEALSVVHEPIPFDLIAGFLGINETARIYDVLEEWEQFLHCEQIEVNGQTESRYRFYHASFIDFIASKEPIASEQINLTEARKKQVEYMHKLIYGD